jgi:chaperonin GroES
MAPAPSPASKRAPRGRRVARLAVDAVRLTADRIVVKHPDAGERTSRGGLLIPATAAPAPKRCVWSHVVLVGPDVRAVRTGDRVLFLPQAGLELELDGDEYLLLRERDVQAVASTPESGDRAPGQYL